MAGKRLEKPNKRRLPLRAWLLYLAVVTFALTGVTFSRYVASAHSQDEGRVITFGDLTVTDSGSVQVQPGVAAQKDLTVRFEGSEAATYVFVELKGSDWTRGADGIYHDAAKPDDVAGGRRLDAFAGQRILSGTFSQHGAGCRADRRRYSGRIGEYDPHGAGRAVQSAEHPRAGGCGAARGRGHSGNRVGAGQRLSGR